MIRMSFFFVDFSTTKGAQLLLIESKEQGLINLLID